MTELITTAKVGINALFWVLVICLIRDFIGRLK